MGEPCRTPASESEVRPVVLKDRKMQKDLSARNESDPSMSPQGNLK